MVHELSIFIFLTLFSSSSLSVSTCVSNQVLVDNECWCVSGYFCASDQPPTACPAGYTSNLGATNENECYVARGVLLNLTVDYVSLNTTDKAFIRALPHGAGLISYEDELMVYVANCPTGYWCPEATGMPIACAAGTYQPDIGAETIDACIPCPVAHFCGAATTTPSSCPAGTYRNRTGALPGECDICEAGGYCPSGSSAKTPAPAGTYISLTGRGSLQDALLCPSGSYCLFGSTLPTPCLEGTYNNLTGAGNETACLTCQSGTFCGQASAFPTACPAGTFSPTVAAVAREQCSTCEQGGIAPLDRQL